MEYLQPVIDWHRRGLVPMGDRVPADPRCRIIRGDFFGTAMKPGTGFDPESPGRRFDAILLDVDHSPSRHLKGFRGGFYEIEGIRALARNLKDGGVFGLWSDDPPDEAFIDIMADVFDEVWGETVLFPNPLYDDGEQEANGVYVGRLEKALEG